MALVASNDLQWRDRDGLSPSSLLFLAETQSYATIRMAFISPPLILVNRFRQQKIIQLGSTYPRGQLVRFPEALE